MIMVIIFSAMNRWLHSIQVFHITFLRYEEITCQMVLSGDIELIQLFIQLFIHRTMLLFKKYF